MLPPNSSCLFNKRIAVLGDSHTLRTFRELRRQLDPINAPNMSNDSNIPPIRTLQSSTSVVIRQLNAILTYIKAPFLFHSDLDRLGHMCCEVDIERHIKEHDIIVLGYGQHPAAGVGCCFQDGHWPFMRYVNTTEQIVPILRAALKQGKYLVWLGITAWQPKKHSVHLRFNLNGERRSLDWRNNYRIQMFNRYSYALMSTLGIPVVDPFQISYPQMHTTRDGAHYLGMVQHAIARVLLSTISSASC
jgi:hypothetical protein